MASRSIAEELLSLVSPYNYRTLIPSLNWHDFITVKDFKKSNLGKLFHLQRGNCVVNGRINNDHLFSLFGQYSDEDAHSVREDILERIESGESVYKNIGKIFFKMHGISFSQWRERTKLGYGDELVLFVLCRVFHRHAVVICKTRNWSTLEPEGLMNTLELLDSCDLYLVYMRPGVFVELEHKDNVTLQLPSPPEFPQWTSHENQEDVLQVEHMGSLEQFVDVASFIGTPTIKVGNENVEVLPKISPISLRSDCVQCLMKHAVRSTPHSLFLQAIDYISWVRGHLPPTPFKCYAATTKRVELYFLRDSKLASCAPNKPCLVIGNYNDMKVGNNNQNSRCISPTMKVGNTLAAEKQIILYENLSVNQSTLDLWIKRAATEETLVIVNRVTDSVISSWKPSVKEAWKDIDPYSDLEEVFSSTEDNATKEATTNSVDSTPKYNLRVRTPKTHRHSTRPQRQSVSAHNYIDISSSSDCDLPNRPKQKINRKLRPGSGPSQERIAAQGKSTVQPILSHPIPSANRKKPQFDISESEELSEEDLIPLINFARNKCEKSCNHKHRPALSSSTPTQSEPVADQKTETPKGKLVTVEHGIKCKYRCNRYFYCSGCEARLNSQGELNKHYRASHELVKCPICQMMFTTPSTLATHKYVHKTERKHPCPRCSQSFVFLSELRVHKLSHRRLRTACQHAGCNKAYFSKNKLAKHVLTHSKIIWSCKESGCTYTTKDKRLLHSHMRVHTDEARFTCEVCGKGFKYHTQWARHKASTDEDACIPLNRSNSPEL